MKRVRLENTVVKRTAHRPLLPHANWWQPGVYASGPAVLLWIAARLPAPFLADAFNAPGAPALLDHVGDSVFVAGWVGSALWLWLTRQRPDAPEPQQEAGTDDTPDDRSAPQHHASQP